MKPTLLNTLDTLHETNPTYLSIKKISATFIKEV